MNTKELLTESKKLIENRENWTQRAYARDKNNAIVFRLESTACKFCATGALYVVADRTGSSDFEAIKLLNAAAAEIGRDAGAVYINDFHGHDDVMKMYDLAIEKAG